MYIFIVLLDTKYIIKRIYHMSILAYSDIQKTKLWRHVWRCPLLSLLSIFKTGPGMYHQPGSSRPRKKKLLESKNVEKRFERRNFLPPKWRARSKFTTVSALTLTFPPKVSVVVDLIYWKCKCSVYLKNIVLELV